MRSLKPSYVMRDSYAYTDLTRYFLTKCVHVYLYIYI